MLYKIIKIACLCLLLTGCSDLPSNSLVEEEVRAAYESHDYSSFYEVVSIEKLNGWESNETNYTVEVEYTVEFTQSLGNIRQKVGDSFFGGFAVMFFELKFGDFERGDESKGVKEFEFIKTENGWKMLTQDKLWD